ncbi:MAG: DUF309 domain-containing protein [Candidatus Sericytochromatia bacterium]
MKRYLVDKNFPPYAFLPAYNPHPKADPKGHSYNKIEKKVYPMNPYNPLDSENYLFGIDLFNHGYYWESHEEWEGLWNAHNKEGTTADFLKALIKISAASVKLRLQHFSGAKTHANTAKKMFEEIKDFTNEDIYAGLSLDFLISFCSNIYENTEKFKVNPEKNVEIIFSEFLELM